MRCFVSYVSVVVIDFHVHLKCNFVNVSRKFLHIWRYKSLVLCLSS